MMMKYSTVGESVITIRVSAARYLPKISSISVMGFVNRSSRVPCFFSSEKLRIVIAGINTTKSTSWIKKLPKNSLIEAILTWKKFIVNRKPDITMKTIITIYATGELK
jgi:hypothetical protein